MTLKELKKLLQDPRVNENTKLKEICEWRIATYQDNKDCERYFKNRGFK